MIGLLLKMISSHILPKSLVDGGKTRLIFKITLGKNKLLSKKKSYFFFNLNSICLKFWYQMKAELKSILNIHSISLGLYIVIQIEKI